MKSNPCLPQLEKARTQQQRPNTAKKKKKKEKSDMSILMDAEKSIWQNSTPFMIKTLKRKGIENFFKLIKNIYKNIQLKSYSRWKIECFPPRLGTGQQCPPSSAIQHSTGSSNQCNRLKKEKRKKRHTDWKGRNQSVPICRWHDSLHRKIPRNLQTNKLLELVNEFSKVRGSTYKNQKKKF